MLTLDDVPRPVIEVARDVARRGYLKSGRGVTVIALLRDDPPNNWQFMYFRDDQIDLAVGFNPALREAVENNTQRYDSDHEISLVVHDCRGEESDDRTQEIVGTLAAVVPHVTGSRPVNRSTKSP